MAAKTITYAEDCRQAMLRGVNKLADAVPDALRAQTSENQRFGARSPRPQQQNLSPGRPRMSSEDHAATCGTR